MDNLRKFHVLGFTFFDTALAFAGMAILAPILTFLLKKVGVKFPMINWIFLTLPFGIIFHIIVGRYTPMTKQFLDIHGYYILKVVIIACVVMGFRGVGLINKEKHSNN